MNQNLESEALFEELKNEFVYEENTDNETQDSEINLLNQLLKKLLSQSFEPKKAALIKDVAKNISEIIKVKSQIVVEERKHAENSSPTPQYKTTALIISY